MSSTSYPTAADTARRARQQSFRVDVLGGGVWRVHNRTSDSTHDVVLDGGRLKCSCESYNFHAIHGPRDHCKHSRVVRSIIDGDFCPHCCETDCRPSCPNRSES